jgi:UTP-glucose-1-phosphate uridylyltransferase
MMFVLAKQDRVIAYNSKETRYDCGSVEGFVIATTHFAEQ